MDNVSKSILHIIEAKHLHELRKEINSNNGEVPIWEEDFIVRFGEEVRDKVGWGHICSYYFLSEEFLSTFRRYIDWSVICSKKKLSIDFVRKHLPFLNMKKFSEYQEIDDEMADMLSGVLVWDSISKNSKVKSSVLNKYSMKVNWTIVSVQKNISYDVLKNCSKINWRSVSLCRENFSLEEVREFKDKIDWEVFTSNMLFTEKELDEFSSYIDWHILSKTESSTKLESKLLFKYKDKLTFKEDVDNDFKRFLAYSRNDYKEEEFFHGCE